MLGPVIIAAAMARMWTYGETLETAMSRALQSVAEVLEDVEVTMGHA